MTIFWSIAFTFFSNDLFFWRVFVFSCYVAWKLFDAFGIREINFYFWTILLYYFTILNLFQ